MINNVFNLFRKSLWVNSVADSTAATCSKVNFKMAIIIPGQRTYKIALLNAQLFKGVG
jgi:hypothetical protein